jgi:hypothetical protein
MAKSFGEMLDTDEPSEEAPVAIEAQPEEVKPPEDGPARNPDGTFAKKGDEGVPPAPEGKQEFDGAATLAERRKRQEAEQRLAELETEIARLKQPQQPEQPQFDPETVFTDPGAYTAHLEGKFQQQLYQQSLMMSDRFARQAHGDELVNAAMEWGRKRCDADPHFNRYVMESGDPVGTAIKEYQRNQIVETVTPEDLAAFRQWQQAQATPVPEEKVAPPTLTGERNLGKRGDTPWAGPRTFGEMLESR